MGLVWQRCGATDRTGGIVAEPGLNVGWRLGAGRGGLALRRSDMGFAVVLGVTRGHDASSAECAGHKRPFRREVPDRRERQSPKVSSQVSISRTVARAADR